MGTKPAFAVKNYFGYNKNVRIYSRNFFMLSFWMQMRFFKELEP